MSKWIAAIHDGLNGADSQRDARIELVIRLADGDLSRLPALAADLVTNHVEAIVAAAPPAVQAAKGATTSDARLLRERRNQIKAFTAEGGRRGEGA